MKLRPAEARDTAAITAIYNHHVCHHTATFEETPLSEAEMAERLSAIQSSYPLLVAESERGECLGYAYATAFKPRSAYRYCAETTVYLAESAKGKGVGTRLYQALLQALTAQGIQQAIAVVTSPNPASAALHQKLGFVQQGQLLRVGYKFDRWLDIEFWQKDLRDRKS
ncbi:GNAT family N-acetyltransferase [Ferrimonas balearica]|uniref:GNAT family N-acetyltransferase n=1 Tax=Ferrimonas balearica TaxID=44012 RepID=UPI001C991AF8|nr:GNAT family N-acetyltransferase [Ferrimonas balearica]MBY5993716.1 GNAT family N-acetyltransferase [Ferrimonas balearica]